MEDILASIRRIIADDQSQGNRAAPGPRRPTPAPSSKAERPADFGEVLDIGRLAQGSDRIQPPRAEPGPAPVRPMPPEPQFQPEDLPRPSETVRTARAAANGTAPAHVNGYASPTLVRGADQGQPADRYATSPEPEAPQRQADRASGDDGLVSPALGTSVMSAFETLAATVVLQNTDLLDRMMRELMRPMIKSWLDENLPGLVERLVRAEIERMARGTRT